LHLNGLQPFVGLEISSIDPFDLVDPQGYRDQWTTQ
jgi:hypothetical protein